MSTIQCTKPYRSWCEKGQQLQWVESFYKLSLNNWRLWCCIWTHKRDLLSCSEHFYPFNNDRRCTGVIENNFRVITTLIHFREPRCSCCLEWRIRAVLFGIGLIDSFMKPTICTGHTTVVKNNTSCRYRAVQVVSFHTKMKFKFVFLMLIQTCFPMEAFPPQNKTI